MQANIGSDELVSRYSVNDVIVWPVSVGQVKKNAQIPHTDDDELLDTQIIPDAVAYVERMGSVALITQTRRVTHDFSFPNEIETRWPLQSVTSLTYLDDDYVSQTVAATNYRALTAGKPGRMQAKNAFTWPTPISEQQAVVLTYKAGFGDDPSSVPHEWRRPVVLLATYWWGHRESYDAQFVTQSFFDILNNLIGAAGGLVRYV